MTDDLRKLIKAPQKMDVEKPDAANLSDMGNAARLVARHGDKIRYVHAMGKWLIWQEWRWEVDETGAIMRLAKETVLAMYYEVPAITSDVVREKLVKWALGSQSRSRLESMISLAKSEFEISVPAEKLELGPLVDKSEEHHPGSEELAAVRTRPQPPADKGA